MKYIYIVIILLFFQNLVAQKNCCDSIKSIVEQKKTYRKKLPTHKSAEITITLDNSNTTNNYPQKKTLPYNGSEATDKDINKLFDWDDFLKIILAIAVALIAGLIALYQMKSNVISSSRIKWNEDLRDSLSKFYSAVLDSHCAYQNFMNAKNENKNDEMNQHYTEYSNYVSLYNSLTNKVMMLLNSDDAEHQKIETIISKIDLMLQSSNIDNINQASLEVELKKIVTSSKIIFKKEWEKSKKLFTI